MGKVINFKNSIVDKMKRNHVIPRIAYGTVTLGILFLIIKTAGVLILPLWYLFKIMTVWYYSKTGHTITRKTQQRMDYTEMIAAIYTSMVALAVNNTLLFILSIYVVFLNYLKAITIPVIEAI